MISDFDNRKLKRQLRLQAQSILASAALDGRFKRFVECGNVPYRKGGDVTINLTSDGKARWGNVSTCGSSWLCPECASRIMARRSADVKSAITKWTADRRHSVYMLTLTQSHTRFDALSNMIDCQASALARFWRNGSVVRLMRSFGVRFKVSVLEITYGVETGWHPHRHILLFSDRIADVAGFESKLRSYWLSSLSAFDSHGNNFALRVNGGTYASKYLTKLADEVSLSLLKRGRTGLRYSPFAMLNHIRETDSRVFKNAFVEYAGVTKGRHQFQMSRGFAKEFDLQDVSDSEIVEESQSDEFERCLCFVPFALYRVLRQSDEYWQVLQCVEAGGVKSLLLWLKSNGYRCVFDSGGGNKYVGRIDYLGRN